ncbi:ribosomal L7Ae/L30e/S12e/Gadd45 family protein [Candidatus Woesearchaeota archaeon]|nr:ribosomal L7Ae/L30e/S12e/Gadd45 family protein [Candidatus Woesearchaeota archaeon]
MADDFVEELKKLVAAEKVILGTDGSLKMLRRGKLVKVVLSSNCDPKVKEDFERYCKLAGIECVSIAQNSDEIGVLCRKPFAISVIGVLA